jgi:hypothetical protein
MHGGSGLSLANLDHQSTRRDRDRPEVDVAQPEWAEPPSGIDKDLPVSWSPWWPGLRTDVAQPLLRSGGVRV